jgi:recombination protein RecA
VVKNKLAPPFRQAEFDIMYDEGISHTGLLVDLGAELNIVDKSGAWYSYGETRLGQGKENSKAFLKDHPELAGQIEEKILAELGIKRGQAAVEEEEAGSGE